MNATKLFLGGVLFLFFGITLIVHTYSNVLPEMNTDTASDTSLQRIDTLIVIDSSMRQSEEELLCSVYFSPGSSYLSHEQQLKINASLAHLSEDNEYGFRIDGFADPTGTGSVNNDRIALHRSFSVYSFLQKRGVSREHLLMRSFGATHGNYTVIDSLRKVDITVIGGSN